MWKKLVHLRLTAMIRHGTLRVRWPDGGVTEYGSGLPEVSASLTDLALPRRLTLNPELAMGEAYVDGTLTIENEDLYGFLNLVISNVPDYDLPVWHRPDAVLQYAMRRLH